MSRAQGLELRERASLWPRMKLKIIQFSNILPWFAEYIRFNLYTILTIRMCKIRNLYVHKVENMWVKICTWFGERGWLPGREPALQVPKAARTHPCRHTPWSNQREFIDYSFPPRSIWPLGRSGAIPLQSGRVCTADPGCQLERRLSPLYCMRKNLLITRPAWSQTKTPAGIDVLQGSRFLTRSERSFRKETEARIPPFQGKLYLTKSGALSDLTSLKKKGQRRAPRKGTKKQRFRFQFSVSGFRVSGFGFWISVSHFWCPVFGFRVSDFSFRVSGFGCQVSVFGFRIAGFGFRFSGFWSWVSAAHRHPWNRRGRGLTRTPPFPDTCVWGLKFRVWFRILV